MMAHILRSAYSKLASDALTTNDQETFHTVDLRFRAKLTVLDVPYKGI